MRDPKGRRIVFGDFVDRIFWALLVGVAGFGVRQMQSLSHSVAELNVNVAVIMSQIPIQKERIDRIENKIERLEERKH